MTLVKRKDNWSDPEDAALIAAWPEGVAAAALAVRAAGRARSPGACKARVKWLRRRGVAVPGQTPAARARLRGRAAGATTRRGCLKCGEDFDSAGPGERVCGECKQGAAWRTASLEGLYL